MNRVPGRLPSGILVVGLLALGTAWFFHGSEMTRVERMGHAQPRGTVAEPGREPEESGSPVPASRKGVTLLVPLAASPEAGAGCVAVPPEVRHHFGEYRLALAFQDHAAEEALYPLLIAERPMALECARESLRAAKNPEDRSLAEKCLRFLEIPAPLRHFHGGRSRS